MKKWSKLIWVINFLFTFMDLKLSMKLLTNVIGNQQPSLLAKSLYLRSSKEEMMSIYCFGLQIQKTLNQNQTRLLAFITIFIMKDTIMNLFKIHQKKQLLTLLNRFLLLLLFSLFWQPLLLEDPLKSFG